MLLALSQQEKQGVIFFEFQLVYKLNYIKDLYIQLNMQTARTIFMMLLISALIGGTLTQQIIDQNLADPWLKDLQFPKNVMRESTNDDEKKLSSAFDILFNLKLELCSTCQSLKFFAIRPLSSTSQYLTVSSNCSGTVSFSPAPVPGRPGARQLLVATQLIDGTWLFEPSTCLGKYIKAISASSLAVVPGLSSNARHWIKHHDNHVHLQSAFYAPGHWSGGLPIQIGSGASSYIVEYWPANPWP